MTATEDPAESDDAVPASTPGDPPRAESPMELTRLSWRYVFVRTAREFMLDRCTDLAAALTFYAVLSVFPALLVMVSALGVFGQGQATVDTLLQMVGDVAPETTVNTVRGPIEQLVETPNAGFALALGLVGALWTASAYVGAFGRALNRIYGIEEGRPVWKLRPMMALVTGFTLLAVGATVLMLVVSGPVAIAIGEAIGLGETTVRVWGLAKWPVMLLLVVMIVAVLYYATPNISRPRLRWVSLGSLIAILLWVAASALFVFYISNFGNYNETYGSLGGAIVFLLWVWITNIALLLGAEFDTELLRARQLQAGIKAENTLQLPRRDTKGIDKKRKTRSDLVRRARRLRRSGGDRH